MAGEEDEVTVVKVEDEVPTEQTDPVAELKAQFDELQAQQKQDEQAKEAQGAREAAETRAREAEARARAAEQRAQSATSEVADTRLSAIDQAIEAAKSAAESAANEHASALEAGDWKKASEAQRKIARAEASLLQQESFKAAWEQQKEAPQRKTPQQEFEDRWPNSARWMREHPDWVSDGTKNAKLQSAHYDAVASGIAVDTPAYFEHVERKIGLRAEPEKPKVEAKTNGRAAVPVAPVIPSPGGTSGGGGVEVTLSKAERDSATDGTLTWNYDDPSGQKKFRKGDPIGVQEFAKRKLAMKKEGRYDRSNYEA